MTATEELRCLLDERGMEWVGTDFAEPTEGHPTNTSLGSEYHDTVFIEYTDGSVLRLFDLTPEQAIAAMLGSGTCKLTLYEDTGITVCSECGAVQPDDWTVYYCWSCGRRVVEVDE